LFHHAKVENGIEFDETYAYALLKVAGLSAGQPGLNTMKPTLKRKPSSKHRVQISWFHAKLNDLSQSSAVSASALLKQFEK